MKNLPPPIDEAFKSLFTRTCDVVEACLGDDRPLMANKIKKIILDEGNDCKRAVLDFLASSNGTRLRSAK